MAEILATYAGGGTSWNPGVEVQDGDAVIWFLRLDSGDSAPDSTRRCSLTDSGGTPITFDYVARGNWGIYAGTYYITYLQGNFAFDGGGTPITDDRIYVMFDQFTNFTAGNHYVKFTPPGTSRARVEAAHLIRGVTPATPGTYLYSEAAPYYILAYEDGGGVGYNGFPASVPLTADSSIIYCLWYMSLGVSQPAGYNSGSGTQITTYTYADPTDPPTITQSIITYYSGLTGASKSVPEPDTDGWSGSPGGTAYNMDAIVINGTETVVPIGPTVYFADMIVFNAATSTGVEF